MLAIAKTKLQT